MTIDRPDHVPASGVSRRSLLQGGAAVLGGLVLAGTGARGGAGGGALSARAADTKPYIPSRLTYAPDAPLAGFFRKVAAGTASIVMAGDSITEGFGAPSPQRGYPARVRARLRNGSGRPPGGPDHLAARYQYASEKVPPATLTYFTHYGPSGVVDLYAPELWTERSSQYGPGRRAVKLSATVVTAMSFRQRSTSFEIAWRAETAGSAITVQIGSAAPVRVAAVGVGEQTWPSTAGPARTETVTIAFAAGRPVVEGVQVFDGDEGGGFHVVEAAQSSTVTAQFSSRSSFRGQPGNDTWADSLDRYDPDLVTSMWGTNDYADRIAPATLTQDTRNYLELVHARCPEAALLVVMPFRPASATAASWAPYIAAQQAAVQQFRGVHPEARVEFFDLGVYVPPLFGRSTVVDNPYMSRDGIHPADAGYDVIGAVLYAFLTSTPA